MQFYLTPHAYNNQILEYIQYISVISNWAAIDGEISPLSITNQFTKE